MRRKCGDDTFVTEPKRRAQGARERPELIVPDRCEFTFKSCRIRIVQFRFAVCHHGLALGQGPLHDFDRSNGKVAIERIDSLSDQWGFVLDFHSHRPIDAHYQRAAGAAAGVVVAIIAATWPTDAFRRRVAGKSLADDCRPLGQDVGIGEAVAFDGAPGRGRQKAGQTFRARLPSALRARFQFHSDCPFSCGRNWRARLRSRGTATV